jgi:hypothetical protein
MARSRGSATIGRSVHERCTMKARLEDLKGEICDGSR